MPHIIINGRPPKPFHFKQKQKTKVIVIFKTHQESRFLSHYSVRIKADREAVKITHLIWPRLIAFAHAMSYHNLSQFSSFGTFFLCSSKISSDQTEEIFSKFSDTFSVHASMNTMGS